MPSQPPRDPVAASAAPHLTPSLCLTATSLSAFLSRARAVVDDPIGQHLSALSSPSRAPFAAAPAGRTPSTSRLPAGACAGFVRATLLPAWRERDVVLRYCEGVAAEREGAAGQVAEPEDEPDERLDPYSARRRWQRPESDVEGLRRVLAAERGIEEVVRRRTWGVLRDRCAGVEGDWTDAMRALGKEV